MSLFEFSHKELAKALLGRTIVVESRNVVILEAKGFSRKENDAGIYKPIVFLQPGQVYCPRSRNAILLLIACKDGMDIGGCVLVRAIEVDGAVVEGPGRVSDALGITDAKAQGLVRELPDGTLTLEMPLLEPPKVRPGVAASGKKRAGNGLGEETLRRHMPAIAKAYLKAKRADPALTFEGMLNALLAECKDEASLRKRLRG